MSNCFIFDFDGTLANTKDVFIDATNAAAIGALGRCVVEPFTLQHLRKVSHISFETIMLAVGCPEEDAKEASPKRGAFEEIFREVFRHRKGDVRACTGAVELLQVIDSPEIVSYLVSANHAETIRANAWSAGLNLGVFEKNDRKINSECGSGKRKALLLGLVDAHDKERVFFFSDTLGDMELAGSLDICGIGYGPGFHSGELGKAFRQEHPQYAPFRPSILVQKDWSEIFPLVDLLKANPGIRLIKTRCTCGWPRPPASAGRGCLNRECPNFAA